MRLLRRCLFGWETEPIKEDGRLAYVMVRNAGSANGGIMPMMEQQCDARPYWLAYFTVASCENTATRMRELGGDVLARPFEIRAGRILVVRDPQGATFALFEGETDD